MKQITTITFIFCLFFVKSQNLLNTKSKVTFRENLVENQMVFYLDENGIVKDSLILNNLYFASEDSLTTVNPGLWSFMYSVRCGSDCKLRKQVLFVSDNHKLKLSYVGYRSMSYDYRETYSKDLSVQPMSNPLFYCAYTFSNSFFKNPKVKELVYKGKSPNDFNSGQTNYYQLKYDSLKKIFYTGTEYLYRIYIIIIDLKNKPLEQKINTVVPTLKFKEVQWVYYNNIWYELNQKGKFLIKFE